MICWPGQASPTEWNNITKVLKHIQLEEHQSVTLAVHPLPDGGDQRPHPDSLPWATRPVFTGLISEDEDDDQQPIQDTPQHNLASSAICYDQKPFETTYRDFLNYPDILDCLKMAPLPHGHHAIKAAAKGKNAARMEANKSKGPSGKGKQKVINHMKKGDSKCKVIGHPPKTSTFNHLMYF